MSIDNYTYERLCFQKRIHILLKDLSVPSSTDFFFIYDFLEPYSVVFTFLLNSPVCLLLQSCSSLLMLLICSPQCGHKSLKIFIFPALLLLKISKDSVVSNQENCFASTVSSKRLIIFKRFVEILSKCKHLYNKEDAFELEISVLLTINNRRNNTRK